MKTLAITGSSGSGKTTISNLFLRLSGTMIINTDEIAREMSQNDKKYFNEIVEYFGPMILDKNRSLDRKKISYIIAENEEAKKQLDIITKRNILPKIDNIIKQNNDKKLIIVDVPILYENNLEGYFDKVLAIISDKEEQISRICKRDNLNKYEAEARLNIQLDNEFFEENADYIIKNVGKSLDELYKEVFAIYIDLIK